MVQTIYTGMETAGACLLFYFFLNDQSGKGNKICIGRRRKTFTFLESQLLCTSFSSTSAACINLLLIDFTLILFMYSREYSQNFHIFFNVSKNFHSSINRKTNNWIFYIFQFGTQNFIVKFLSTCSFCCSNSNEFHAFIPFRV